jgi:hypothetical protein
MPEVFDRVAPELQEAVRLNLQARRELHELVPTVHDAVFCLADHRRARR